MCAHTGPPGPDGAPLSPDCPQHILYPPDDAAARQRAQWIFVHEAAESATAGEREAAVRGCEKLGRFLATLMGTEGVQSLLARALSLARSEVPWLTAVQVGADGALAGFREAAVKQEPESAVAGGQALLVQVLALLDKFIGETLTLHLLQKVWPNLPDATARDPKETR